MKQNKKMSEAHKGKHDGGNNPNSSKVICVETGVVFNCIKDAQAWAGKTGISACCRGERKTCGGYHWAYYEDVKKE